MLNALTIDLEDYYHVNAFDNIIDKQKWDTMENRIPRTIDKVLSLLDEYKVKATFFVLGWVAERQPIVIKTIANEDHEIASHGYDHTLISRHTQQSFTEDIVRTKNILEDILGTKIKGYRAPSFSINKSSLWALSILAEHGHVYDSSIFPIVHDRYGIPDAQRFPHAVVLKNKQTIREFPPSTIRLLKWNFPIAGGGYLRLFPVQLIAWGIKRLNTIEKQPAVIYLHPWEFDPGQPRIPAGMLSRFRHYQNLDSTEKKLRYLIRKFKFTTLNKLCSLQ